MIEETKTPGFSAEDEADALGLPVDRLDCRAAELSGGERRRAALLRALSVAPDVLVLDEPTASLDHAAACSVVDTVLRTQARRGLACLLITHDLEMAQALSHRLLTLHQGRLG